MGEQPALNIYQKLVAVRSEIEHVVRDQRNEKFQFSYVSASSLLSLVRPLLDKHGLYLQLQISRHTLLPKWGESKERDRSEHLTELEIEFTWINAEKPDECAVCVWYGQGLDTGEKGIGKALTYALKYFLLSSFQIPTDEDDPDRQASPPAHRSARSPREREGANAAPQSAGPERLITTLEECWMALRELGLRDKSFDAAKTDAGMGEHPWDSLDRESLEKIVAAAKAKKSKARQAKTGD